MKATFFSLAAAAVILYVAGYFFTRTEGFRAFLEDQLEKQVGERIEIADSRSTFGGDLILEGLTLAGPDAGTDEPVASAGTVRAQMAWTRLLTGGLPAAVRAVEVTGWKIRFSRDAEGRWHPSGLAVTGEWLRRWGGLDVPVMKPGAAGNVEGEGGSGAPGEQLKRIAVHLRDGEVEWRTGASAIPLARVEGIRFAQTPLELPTGSATHYHVQAESAAFVEKPAIDDLEVEILVTDDGPHVLTLEVGSRTAAPPVEDGRKAWQRYPLADKGTAPPPAADTEDIDAFRARIRRELKSALE